ncbi:putative exported protein [Halobacteriovorax marinus SJ]|uniref:Exported protein n=1 Tax=Halobacteriovorax marinus (strain ATCC BAA-682 / DSM 15412 / SJ) TaxID=862908 RepID=E1X091_HALMS|nr:hypothetical protein [Halobacteriovorax marinus]CBW26319.1 putative exported protein [Halobacteriovorax marinus SJ]
MIVSLYKYIVFFLCLVLIPLRASAIDIKISEDLREAYDMYREIKKAGGFELVEVPKESVRETALCVSCHKLSGLTKEVNKVLLALAENEDKLDPSKRTVEEVEGLSALYHYTLSEGDFFKESVCERFDDSHNREFDENIDFSRAHILASNEIPIANLNSFHLRDGKKRTFFYKAKGEEDLYIRIDVHDQEKARITYYKLNTVAASGSNGAGSSVAQEPARKKKKRESWSLWTGSSEDDEPQTESESHISYGAGVSIEHKDHLPRKLTLIKGNSFTTLGSALGVKTSTELSTKEQVASISLSSSKGDDYAKLELDKDVLELQVPTKVDILDSGLKLETVFSMNSNEEQEVSFSLAGERRASTSLILRRDERGNSGTLARTQRFGESQSLSVQFTGGDSRSNEAWIRYELAF